MATAHDKHVIGCFTPSRGRQLMTRACIMQMISQSRRPDYYSLFINGNTQERDCSLFQDLLTAYPWINKHSGGESMLTVEVKHHAMQPLLHTDTSLFVMIDSDDVYDCDYLERYVRMIDESLAAKPQPNGFCFNLINQRWIDTEAGQPVLWKHWPAVNGLGITPSERKKGIVCGAPPTYVFDRKAAEALQGWRDHPRYSVDTSSDRSWRNMLFDAGIPITCVGTVPPIFGYVRHESNTCKLIS